MQSTAIKVGIGFKSMLKRGEIVCYDHEIQFHMFDQMDANDSSDVLTVLRDVTDELCSQFSEVDDC